MSDKYGGVGVDLEAGYESVHLIKNHVARTKVEGATDSIGTFGGMFNLSVLNMKEPVLVSRTDGVDTKLLVAFEVDKHDTVGINAVTMRVDDVLVQGAALILFLNYLAVGKNGLRKIEQLIKGIMDGRVQAECALIGGETTEMPDVYDVKHRNIAGFCVDTVDKCNLLDGQKIKGGNVLVGLPSTGVHSSGSSLILEVLLKDTKLDLYKEYEEIGNRKLGDVLLTSTKIYVKATKHLLGKVDIKGVSHITGGGFCGNAPRILKGGQGVTTDTTAYPHRPIFNMITRYGNIPMDEMCNIFNMDVDFMMAVDKEDVDTVQSLLKEIYKESYVIGGVANSGSVDIKWQIL